VREVIRQPNSFQHDGVVTLFLSVGYFETCYVQYRIKESYVFEGTSDVNFIHNDL